MKIAALKIIPALQTTKICLFNFKLKKLCHKWSWYLWQNIYLKIIIAQIKNFYTVEVETMSSREIMDFVTMLFIFGVIAYNRITELEKIKELEKRLKWYEDNLKWEVYKLWRENERENERNKDE